MGMAVGKVHWGRPIWVTEGGAELPVTNMAIAASLALTGPGRISLDRLHRPRAPWPLTVLTAVGVAAGVALGLNISRERPEETAPAAEREVESQQEAATARQQAEVGTAQERV